MFTIIFPLTKLLNFKLYSFSFRWGFCFRVFLLTWGEFITRQAQALMLLASERSSSNIAGTKIPKTDTEASPYRSNATLANKPNVLES